MKKYISYCDRRIAKKWIFKELTQQELLKMFPLINQKIVEKIESVIINKKNQLWIFDKKGQDLQVLNLT